MASKSLWDDDDDNAQAGATGNSGAVERKLSYDALVVSESGYADQVEMHVQEFPQMVHAANQLLDMCFDVSNFAPSDQQRAADPQCVEKWKVVQPLLVGALVECIKARRHIGRCLADIGNLGEVIKTNAKLIHLSRGSASALAVARADIPAQLRRLDADVDECERLFTNAVAVLENNANAIFDVVGSAQVLSLADAVHEFEREIESKQELVKKLTVAVKAAQGKLKGINNLVHMYDVRLAGRDEALARTREREALLTSKMNDADEKMSQVATSHRHVTSSRSFFGLFQSDSSRIVQNPDRDGQREFYKSLVKAHEAELKTTKATAADEEAVKQQLADKKAELLEQFETADGELLAAAARYFADVPRLLGEIGKLQQKIADKKQAANKLESTTGLRGPKLIECLNSLRQFSRAQAGHATVCEPMANLLNTVIAQTKSAVAMLGGTDADVYVGGALLLTHVGFMSSVSIALREINVKTVLSAQRAAAIEAKVEEHKRQQQENLLK